MFQWYRKEQKGRSLRIYEVSPNRWRVLIFDHNYGKTRIVPFSVSKKPQREACRGGRQRELGCTLMDQNKPEAGRDTAVSTATDPRTANKNNRHHTTPRRSPLPRSFLLRSVSAGPRQFMLHKYLMPVAPRVPKATHTPGRLCRLGG